MSLRISDTQHNNAMPCAECRYAECRILLTIMLSVIMLNVVMLNVVAPKLDYASGNNKASFFDQLTSKRFIMSLLILLECLPRYRIFVKFFLLAPL